jgi:hypothetical protein
LPGRGAPGAFGLVGPAGADAAARAPIRQVEDGRL